MAGLLLSLMLLAGPCPEGLSAADSVTTPRGHAQVQPANTTASTTASTTGRALAVLRAWDLRRARAFAAGDATALRGLYVAGSGAGRNDVAVLRSYADRGLYIDGLTTQVLSAGVRASTPGLLRIRVVDRVRTGTIVGTWQAWPLPREQPRVHLIEMRQMAGRWLVASVRVE